MQGDALHAQQEVGARVRALTQKASRIQALRDQVLEELELRCKEIDQLAARIDVLVKVGELFRALMDKLVMTHVRSVEHVITEGLKSIFFDQTLSFEAEVSTRRDRICVDFVVRQERSGGKYVVRGDPMTNFGGGPATIASLVLRLLVLMKLKRRSLLFLDETLSAISPEYIDQTCLFLNKLSTSTGTPILLVTQQHAYMEHCTLAYAASEHSSDGRAPCLQVHKVRGSS